MAKSWSITGRTAFITGAARGIGAESARRLHARGANVALVGLEPDLLEELSAELGDRAAPFEADVTDAGALERAVKGARDRFGGVDVAIANAGIQMTGSLASAPAERIERVLEVNLMGVWRTDRAVLPQIRERQGYLLNIASLAAVMHGPLMGPYSASKAAVEALSNVLRVETAPTGARVGCAYFGFIETDLDDGQLRAALGTGHAQRHAVLRLTPCPALPGHRRDRARGGAPLGTRLGAALRRPRHRAPGPAPAVRRAARDAPRRAARGAAARRAGCGRRSRRGPGARGVRGSEGPARLADHQRGGDNRPMSALALPDDVRVAVVGSGFGGIGAAIRLREAGIEDMVVLERAGEVGGTWRENTYPGCACDVPSHLYSFSFALNPDWSRMFAPQEEILDYLRRTVRERGVEEKFRFDADVRSAHWDDDAQRWRIDTGAGPLTAQVLLTATGPLSQPSIPDIPGLHDFEGTMFHSAEWDHGHDLSGERVAVIGTGASSAQFIPHVQRTAGSMDVFQRTPPWVLPRPDFAHGPRTRALFRRFPGVQRALRMGVYYFAEGLVYGLTKDQRALRPNEALGRALLRRQVRDPVLREKLTPDYRIGCKRIVFANDYYRALAQPNADVITDGIREVVPDGIVTVDGRHRPYDTILLGTGFKVWGQAASERVIGRDGRSLREAWEPSGPVAYRGTAVSGFPNHFLLIGPNTGLGNNSMINIIEAQLEFVVDALRTMERSNLASVEVRPDAQELHNEEIQEKMVGTVWTGGGCKSWYLTEDGINRTLWPSYSDAFKRQLAHFHPEDFTCVPAPAPTLATAA